MSDHEPAASCHHDRPEGADERSGISVSLSARASRREFIKGVIASGVAVSAAGYVVVGRGTEAFAQAAGTVTRLVTLNVNGRDRPVDVLPNETLIHTLRYKLGLTGTKLGCDHAECGNCTVMLDDVATYSCSTLTHGVRGRKIVYVGDGNNTCHSLVHVAARLGAHIAVCSPEGYEPNARVIS